MEAEYFQSQVRQISDADLFSALTVAGDYEAWAKHWAKARTRVLFLNADEFLSPLQTAAESLEPQRAKILEAASRLIAHEITGWGDVTIVHGPVVNFNADCGEAGQYGFHYWDWARPLIQSFLLTRDQKYLSTFEELFNQWYDQRDSVKGRIETLDVIWYELGLARRSRIFLECYALASDLPRLTHERMLKTLLGAARWLHEEQKKGNRLGNWQVMGAYALGLIALSVPEFRESAEWLTVAVDRLAWHLEKDFYPDGCHWERCPSSYMLTVYSDLKNLSTLLERNEKHQADKLAQPLTRSLAFYHSILPADNVIPAINDGRRRPLPATMLADLHQAHPEPPISRHLPESGFTVLRHQEKTLLINHGPPAGGHSHLDALSFELHAFGQPLAIDSGIGLTYDDPNYATWYRRAIAHNMLTIADADPDRKATAAKDIVFTQHDQFDYFTGMHEGYLASHGIRHRRHFLFAKPDYILIFDELSQTDQDLPLEWHLHSPLQFDHTAQGFSSSTGFHVIPSDLSWKSAKSSGLASVSEVPLYDSPLAPVTWLKFSRQSSRKRPTQFAVLLHLGASQPVFKSELAPNSARFQIVTEGQADTITLAPEITFQRDIR
jgi:hypothetical protein